MTDQFFPKVVLTASQYGRLADHMGLDFYTLSGRELCAWGHLLYHHLRVPRSVRKCCEGWNSLFLSGETLRESSLKAQPRKSFASLNSSFVCTPWTSEWDSLPALLWSVEISEVIWCYIFSSFDGLLSSLDYFCPCFHVFIFFIFICHFIYMHLIILFKFYMFEDR
jgi:hypothetical protein